MRSYLFYYYSESKNKQNILLYKYFLQMSKVRSIPTHFLSLSFYIFRKILETITYYHKVCIGDNFSYSAFKNIFCVKTFWQVCCEEYFISVTKDYFLLLDCLWCFVFFWNINIRSVHKNRFMHRPRSEKYRYLHLNNLKTKLCNLKLET